MKKSILLVTVAFLAISSLTVFAQSGSQNGSDTDTSGQGGTNSQKCEDVTRKVGTVVERYNQSQEKYMNTFQNVFENVEQIALKFKADGYDTTQLESNLAQYSNMIQNANRHCNSFQVGMDNAKKGICGNSESEALQEFNSARDSLQYCKDEMLDMRDFAQGTLKQDLLNLKDQVTE